jgi:N-acetyl-anhydromuramyl-L-alanine amidase AmpD
MVGRKARATICDKIAFTYTLEWLNNILQTQKKIVCTFKNHWKKNNVDGFFFSLDELRKLVDLQQ